jgi:hypothetical protein
MKSAFLLLALTLSFSSFAKEGGNGGGVHVCGNKVELYDFFESRSQEGHNIEVWKADKKMTMDQYIQKAIAHLQQDLPAVSWKVSDMVKQILSTKPEDLFFDITIPVIRDANITIIGEGCHYEQAANWDEKFGRLFISKTIFKKFNSMNQAGLIIHEAIYKLSRDTKVATETSDLVREVVAKIFSDMKLSDKDSEVISSQDAVIKATRPTCEIAKKNISEIEYLMNQDGKRLVVQTANFCLKYCLIPVERAFCQEKLDQYK